MHFCVVLLTHVFPSSLKDIHVVREFSDIFPDELHDSLVDRKIEFHIDLNPSTRPIFKAPYHMSPLKLKKLKVQLQDLLEKNSFVLVFHLGVLLCYLCERKMKL